MQITNIEQIKFNCLTEEQYQAAKEAGTLVETEFYLTKEQPSSSINIDVETHTIEVL